jgi:homospermidine synthase
VAGDRAQRLREGTRQVAFAGEIVMIGCGSIGQAVLPLLLGELGLDPDRLTVVTADQRGRNVADALGVRFDAVALTSENVRDEVGRRLGPGDFLLNLSVEVSSLELLQLANERGALYLDTGIEPWPGGYTDPSLSPGQRTNHEFQAKALALRGRIGAGRPTAVICQGANPSLVSQLVKAAVLELARAVGAETQPPAAAAGWAGICRDLGIRTIQIAEHDSQVSRTPKAADEFVSTWPVDGFLGEGSQPAELGCGTAEGPLPADGCWPPGGGPSIYLLRPGIDVRVRS